MKFLVLTFLNFFDFFHKRKILKVLKNLLKNKNKIFFDVGAHQGETIIFLKKNFICSNIFAFEPLNINFLKLKKNTKKFHKDILYFNFALGEKKEIKFIKQMTETSSSTFNEINEQSNYFKRKKFLLGLGKKEKIYTEKKVSIEKAVNTIKKFKIKKIDLLKIDTEGYELKVIKGFEKEISKVKIILFEHHYDLMIKKNYTFRAINKYLKNKGFNLEKKYKMPFRKAFEYIYANEKNI